MRKIFVMLALFLVVFSSCEENLSLDKEKENEENPKEEEISPTDFASVNFKKAWGTDKEEDFGGAVISPSGYLYFTGTREPMGYAADLFVTKVDLSTNTKVWAKSYDTGDADYHASFSENGHTEGGGGSRNIAIDENGNIYVCGNTIRSGSTYDAVVVMKIDANGNILWKKFWQADNSNLARSSARCYALDYANGRVFVAGTTGAGIGQPESNALLLTFNADNGSLLGKALFTDPSSGYNDRIYTVKATPDGKTIYAAGWEGKNNQGIIFKFSYLESTTSSSFVWAKRIDIGYAARFADIDIDAAQNLYLAADHRGVYTYLGIVKTDKNGTVLWSAKYNYKNDDRNNISCLRVLNGALYVGGRINYNDYWGDGLLLKYNLNGTLLKQYTFLRSGNNACGERIESILSWNGKLIVAGEAWPNINAGMGIDGNWYMPNGVSNETSVEASAVVSPEVTSSMGHFVTRTMIENTLGTSIKDMSAGSQGSSDVIYQGITE